MPRTKSKKKLSTPVEETKEEKEIPESDPPLSPRENDANEPKKKRSSKNHFGSVSSREEKRETPKLDDLFDSDGEDAAKSKTEEASVPRETEKKSKKKSKKKKSTSSAELNSEGTTEASSAPVKTETQATESAKSEEENKREDVQISKPIEEVAKETESQQENDDEKQEISSTGAKNDVETTYDEPKEESPSKEEIVSESKDTKVDASTESSMEVEQPKGAVEPKEITATEEEVKASKEETKKEVKDKAAEDPKEPKKTEETKEGEEEKGTSEEKKSSNEETKSEEEKPQVEKEETKEQEKKKDAEVRSSKPELVKPASPILTPLPLKVATRDRAALSGRRRPSISRKHTPVELQEPAKSSSAASSTSKSSDEPSVLMQYLQAESARRQAMLMTNKRTAEIRARPRAFSMDRPVGLMQPKRMHTVGSGLGGPMKAISQEAQKLRSTWNQFPTGNNTPKSPTEQIEKSLEQLDRERRETEKKNKVVLLSAVKKAREEPHVNRLIHCKGKNRVHVKLVEVSTSSLNQGDSFVLDLGQKIYCWHGSKANFKEKHKANTIAEIIKNHERNGSAQVKILDEDDDENEFWEALGGRKEIASAESGGNDIEKEKEWATSLLLYEGRWDEGSIVFDRVEYSSLKMEELDTTKCFLLDSGTEVFAWVGKEAQEDLKREMLEAAEKFSESTSRPSWVKVLRVQEGGEPVLFREKFVNWPDLSHDVCVARMGLGKAKVHQISREYQQRKRANSFDVSEMMAPKDKLNQGEEENVVTFQEKLEVWRIEGFKKVLLPETAHGHFYSGNCYILHYTHTLRREGAIKNQLWVWQGRHRNKNEAGSGALQANEMIDNLKRRVDVNNLEVIIQGKETDMFLYAFSNRMIIHKGREEKWNESDPHLYHVIHSHGSHAVEATLSASSLNSKDAFLLQTPTKQYLWIGQGCMAKRKDAAKELAKHFKGNREHELIPESKEPQEFWDLIGGKSEYANAPYLKKSGWSLRWFWINQDEGFFAARETPHISQEELASSKIALLDVHHQIFLWTGTSVNELNKKKALEIALEYLKLSKEKEYRPDSCQVYAISGSQEPFEFTCHFPAWDRKETPSPLSIKTNGIHSNGSKTSSPMASPVTPSSPLATSTPSTPTTPSTPVLVAEEVLKSFHQTFPLETLRKKDVPKEVDLTCLEAYLSPEDFLQTFGTTKEEFYKMPKWKQISKRKSAGLF